MTTAMKASTGTTTTTTSAASKRKATTTPKANSVTKKGYSISFDDSEEEGKCESNSKKTKAPAVDNYPEDVPVCWICGGTPCDWTEYSTEVMEHIDSKFPLSSDGTHHIDAITKQVVPNQKIRFVLYKTFTYLRYGHLGRGVCIPLCACVESKVKELFPNEEGTPYTGFQCGEEDLSD